MDSKNGVVGVDASSSLLFEDSGDSETDAEIHADDVATDIFDDQDAESCSCDTCDDDKHGFTDHQFLDCDDQDSGNSSGINHGDDDHHEPSTSGCNQLWLSDENSGCLSRKEGEEETKVDKIDVDEMEDRLFWETCMEVGYP